MDSIQGLALILTVFLIQYGYPAINLSDLPLQSLQPRDRQYFKEQPQNLTVIEGESVTLRCTIGHLSGNVQWSADGYAMGYTLEQIQSYCSKCSPMGDNRKGEYHLYVRDVEYGRFNDFECQVSPDNQNQHEALRAKASLNVLVPPSKLELVNTDASISIKAGEEYQLTCRARDAKPTAKIVWYQGDHKIVDQLQGYSNQVTEGLREGTWDTINTLKFRARASDDGSSIRCVAEHQALRHSRLEKKIDLTVYYPPGEPQIIGDTLTTLVSEGDMINVTCLSQGGNPAPQMSWFRGNSKLQYPTVRLGNGSTVSHLVIRAQPKHLNDVFSCKVWNTIGQSLISRDVKFNVTFSGTAVQISGPDTAQIGSEVSLSCSSQESNPPSIIKWTVDGVQHFATQNDNLVAVSQGGWRTTSVMKLLVNVNFSQMKVTCSAVNNFYSNELQDTKVIRILRPPEAPTISGLPQYSLREGDPLELSCISRHGSPLPMLKWFRQGEYIENQNFTRKENDQSIARLFLVVSRSDNHVQYSCEASNGDHFPSVSQKTNFSVYFEPKYSKLYLSQDNDAAPEEVREVAHSRVGDRLQLNCQSGNSNPPAKITWHKNGNEVRGGPLTWKQGKYGGRWVTQVFKLNEGNPITSLDNGSKFSCTVSNPAINANNVTKDYILNVRFPPEFNSSPGRFTVIEGDDISINVDASANPPIRRFTWSSREKDSFPDRFQIKDSTINIRKTQRQDAGLYLLEASNDLGEKSKEIILTVEYYARIVNITHEVIVDEGETAIFKCTVDANPISEKTVRWVKSDDEKFIFDGRTQMDYDGDLTFTLILKNVRKSDRGEFSCVANNQLVNSRNHTKKAVLKVNFKPEIRNFPRFSKFAQILMHQIDLKCVAYGYPNVSIFWRKAGENLDSESYLFNNDGKAKKIGYSTWESTLTIESVLNYHYTTYQCVAKNELGTDTFNISLTTNSIPEPPVNLEVKKKDHKTVELKWEPGFDGGFQQHFETRIKEVSTGKVEIVKSDQTALTADTQFVYQDVIINPDIKYAFAVKAVNVQGFSKFSMEKIKELKASENKAKDKDAVPRVIIVAIVLGLILFVIIFLMIITCCIKQRKENRRREEKKLERSSSLSSKRSMMIDRYPTSKYTEAFPGEMFISPPSRSSSHISVSNDHPDYKYLGRSMSTGLGAESDRGYESYRAGTCSVHGTLKRHISSGIDTTMEEDVFDDYSDSKVNGGPAFPFITADMMLKGGKSRSRAGSLSSPGHMAPPRLGVSGLYTDHMERRKYSTPPSHGLSPPMIPSPPPPVNTSTLSRKFRAEQGLPPPPPPVNQKNVNHCKTNGHINMVDFNINDKKSALDASHDLTKRIAELGQERMVEPGESLGHLQIKDLPELSAYPQLANQKYFNSRPSNTSGFM